MAPARVVEPHATRHLRPLPCAGTADHRIREGINVADRRELAAIFVGGACGALLRAGLGTIFPWTPGHWPWPTFGVNIVGCLLLGYFVTRLQERLPLSAYRRPFLGTGLCGGLTTFSTMQVELLKMIRAHDYGFALLYGVISVIGGYLAIHVATVMVRRVRVRV